ncbi:hypothetical protein H5203_14680 [Pseudoalteromonas sp. SG41-1]|uniref:hypothetical protein n=1 Tax=Pseudoalteromonas TaxID=53246 RepID=UPI001603F45A|nr:MULTISPECIES: hypothetical protein [unclassified Pseudoalteromonas]MBB1310426.1 hypothetical protein [Pseudoalteromonas sp. SR41-8]MBB1398045.1 hypothetical protein [Pseudoalteromonas sp. SG44-8]MBB1506730.1 hypothetical protein [Pseudoalteromonas sp. SG41-1]
MLKCNQCAAKKDFKIHFWMSKIDMVGFIFLSLCLSIPIGIVAFLAEESQSFARFIAFAVLIFAAIKKHKKVVALLIVELVIDWALDKAGMYEFNLMVATAFILTFIKIGSKVYGFFFQCVNYKFDLDIFCPKCNKTYKKVRLPESK